MPPYAPAVADPVAPLAPVRVSRPAVRGRVREAARWAAWSLPALPAAVLVHELAHMAWLVAFRVPGVRLHFAAVTHASHDAFWQLARAGRLEEAARVVPLAHIGTATAAGIVVSYATILAAAWHTTRRVPHPFVVALGLCATLRFRLGTQILERQLTTGDRSPSGTDEGLVATVTGISEPLLWGIGLAVAAVGIGAILRGLWRRRLLGYLVPAAVGAVAGVIAYVGWLGPRLLP